MPWPSDVDGYPPIYLYIASLGLLSLLRIFCPVQGRGHFPLFVKMRYAMLLLLSWQKFVMMFHWSWSCNHSPVRSFPKQHQLSSMVPGWRSQWVGSGVVDFIGPTWTSGFLTLMLRPIEVPTSLTATGSISMRKSELTSRGSLRWSTRHLHDWYFPLQVEWRGSRRYFIKEWPPCLQRSRIKHIDLQYAGFAAGFHFPCCAWLFNVSAVLVPVMAVPLNLHILSTWSMLKHSFLCLD